MSVKKEINVPDVILLTVPETAALLRLSQSAIRSWILQKKIPYIKLQNKAIRIQRSDVDALIAASIVPAKVQRVQSDKTTNSAVAASG